MQNLLVTWPRWLTCSYIVSDFIWPFLPPYMGVIPNPKMAFIFPNSCILVLIFPIFLIYFPKCEGKGSFPKSEIKSLIVKPLWKPISPEPEGPLPWARDVGVIQIPWIVLELRNIHRNLWKKIDIKKYRSPKNAFFTKKLGTNRKEHGITWKQRPWRNHVWNLKNAGWILCEKIESAKRLT